MSFSRKIQVFSAVLCLLALAHCSGGAGIGPSAPADAPIAGDNGVAQHNVDPGNNAGNNPAANPGSAPEPAPASPLEPAPGPLPDNEPATVISSNPSDGQILTASLPAIRVEFSAPMDPASVNQAFQLGRTTFGFAGAGNFSVVPVAVPVVSDNNRVFEFPIIDPITRGSFRISVGGEAKDANQTPIQQAFTSNFSIKPPVEDGLDTPPQVVSINPPDGSDGVPRQSILQITFNQPMATAIVKNNLSLLKITVAAGINNFNEEEVDGTVTACPDKKTFLINPKNILERTQKYKIRVKADAKNSNGIALGEEVSSDFETKFGISGVALVDCP